MTTTEHSEALDEYEHGKRLGIESAEANIDHTRAHAEYERARAKLYGALSSAVVFGALVGIGWSVFAWVVR